MERTAPHRRWNPLRRSWVLVSPQRAERPWKGAIEAIAPDSSPEYDAQCPLCPGNARARGKKNPLYESVFVFDNDFPALLARVDEPPHLPESGDLIRAESERGICRVVCFSPSHRATLPDLALEQIAAIIRVWGDEYEALRINGFVKHVMIFENKGEMMGCSNPHPHSQIWATESVPHLAHLHRESQADYWRTHGRALLTDYLQWEMLREERHICGNEHWQAVVPFWAEWPFEALVLPRRQVASISALLPAEVVAWAELIKTLTGIYDALFSVSFPYSMGVYQAPFEPSPGFCMHQLFLPPLLRSAHIRKFMVGYELCVEPQRDLTPEQAASSGAPRAQHMNRHRG